MQQIRYAQTAWNDIKNSPGWFGKIALLALLQLIPIFGQIVLLGYLYGWARDIAWGVHAPLPAKIFGNEDGKLYSRGFFILVVFFVLSCIPALIYVISGAIVGGGIGYSAHVDNYAPGAIAATVGGFLGLVGFAASILVAILCNVAGIRTAIYDRISAGLQLKKIWAMFRYDTNGVLRIFGMEILISLIIGLILSIVTSIFIVIVFGAAAPALVGLTQYGSPSSGQIMAALGPAFGGMMAVSLIMGFVGAMCSIFLSMMVARATGYWTRQFQVAHWRGQDDPMPFEAARAQQQAQAAQYAAQVEYAQAQAQYAQAQGQQINYQNQQAQQQYAQAQQALAQQQAQAQQPYAPTQQPYAQGQAQTPVQAQAPAQAQMQPFAQTPIVPFAQEQPQVAPEQVGEPAISSTESAAAPVIEFATTPVAESAAAPVVETATTPMAETAAAPTTESAAAPVIESAAELEPTAEPAAAPSAEPTIEPTIEPAADLAAESALEPSDSVASEPPVTPTSEEPAASDFSGNSANASIQDGESQNH